MLIDTNTSQALLDAPIGSAKPSDRLASHQGNVDWFCFWLKGEEDPDSAKAKQFAGWRELKKILQGNDKNVAEEKGNSAPQKE